MNYVLYTTDANYWMHLYVSLYSLLVNNKKRDFMIYILTDERNDEFDKNLNILYKIGNLIACQVIVIDLHDINWPTYHHVSKAAHFRLFITDHLPEEVKKILYLDCDTIIDGPIGELLDLDLSAHVIAAAPDDNWPKHSKRLNLPQGVKYFNSGVLLINMNSWVLENVEYRYMEYQ